MVFMVIELLLIIVVFAGVWKTFEKAGQPGWAGIIPIYNLIIMLKMTGKPIWWILLFLIPIVNIVIAILVFINLAASFGKGVGFAVGLALLGFIFWPILGFGDAKYLGQVNAAPGFPPIMKT